MTVSIRRSSHRVVVPRWLAPAVRPLQLCLWLFAAFLVVTVLAIGP